MIDSQTHKKILSKISYIKCLIFLDIIVLFFEVSPTEVIYFNYEVIDNAECLVKLRKLLVQKSTVISSSDKSI